MAILWGNGLHSHGRLCAVRGFADLYALTGEQRWREVAERDWQIFASHYLLIASLLGK